MVFSKLLISLWDFKGFGPARVAVRTQRGGPREAVWGLWRSTWRSVWRSVWWLAFCVAFCVVVGSCAVLPGGWVVLWRSVAFWNAVRACLAFWRSRGA